MAGGVYYGFGILGMSVMNRCICCIKRMICTFSSSRGPLDFRVESFKSDILRL